MVRIVVGGHTRNIGKTQLVVEIIRTFPQARWTAVKITQFGHGICSVNGESCHCAVDEHRFALTEERDAASRADTARFLAAGAEHSLWLRTKQGRLAEAMPLLEPRLAGVENVILESNAVLEFLRADLYLPVLDFSREDFKDSARAMLDRADAFVLRAPVSATPASPDTPLEALRDRPLFIAWPDRLCSPALEEFIRRRVFAPAAAARPSRARG